MRKTLAAGIVGILALVPVVLSAPSAQAQVTDDAPGINVCKVDGTWNFTESRPHSPVRVSDFVADGLVLDITGDRTHDAGNTVGGKVAGYVAITPTLLSDIDVASLDYAVTTGALPGYQLVVDRTPSDPGDGYDGILVGEPGAYGNVWWATKPTRWVGGPEDITVGTNSDVDGTLAAFAAFDPDTTVTTVGFSLGTLGVGTEARGVLKSLTFNQATWDFGLCPTIPPTSTTTTSPTTTTTTTTETSSTTTSTTPVSTTATTTSTTSSTPIGAVYANCEAVRQAGKAPIYAADPGFETRFDSDGDGIGCEADIVNVGNDTDNLAYTGTSSLGQLLAVAGCLILASLAAFGALYVQRRRNTQ